LKRYRALDKEFFFRSTAKAGFKEPGFKEQAGFKELFLVTGILLSKKAGFTVVRKSYHTPLWGHLIKGPQFFHFFELGLENWYTYPPK